MLRKERSPCTSVNFDLRLDYFGNPLKANLCLVSLSVL